jgi:hypothetical protein
MVLQEPLDPSDPFWQDRRVVTTPHVAGVTELSYRTMAGILAGIVSLPSAIHVVYRGPCLVMSPYIVSFCTRIS